MEVSLHNRQHKNELPASVGKLHRLKELRQYECSGLDLAACRAWPAAGAGEAQPGGCSDLMSLPDISGLKNIKVSGLPEIRLFCSALGFRQSTHDCMG